MEQMFLPLKRYAEFSGRSRRKEFWMWALFQVLLAMLFMVLMVVLGGAALFGGLAGDAGSMVGAGAGFLLVAMLWGLVGLALFIPSLAVMVRRLHDTDRSGHWVWLFWGPYLPSIVLSFGAAGDPGGGAGLLVTLLSIFWLCGTLVLLVFMVLDGTKGPNRFGLDPKGNVGEAFS